MSVVLLVDDEPDMGALVAMTLEDLDVQVVQAASLGEALAAARSEQPSLVLLDLALGEEDGLAILPRLREEPALARVPVVVLTVHDSRREEALALGVEGFLSKPFRAEGLREAVGPLMR